MLNKKKYNHKKNLKLKYNFLNYKCNPEHAEQIQWIIVQTLFLKIHCSIVAPHYIAIVEIQETNTFSIVGR